MNNRAATIVKAYFACTNDLARGPGSALVGNLLRDVAGPQVCLVEVLREEMPFTLALDSGWAELGVQLKHRMTCTAGHVDLTGMELPRPALRAVVDGWPDQWDDEPDPQIDVHFTEDNLPHVSLIGAAGRPDHRKATRLT